MNNIYFPVQVVALLLRLVMATFSLSGQYLISKVRIEDTSHNKHRVDAPDITTTYKDSWWNPLARNWLRTGSLVHAALGQQTIHQTSTYPHWASEGTPLYLAFTSICEGSCSHSNRPMFLCWRCQSTASKFVCCLQIFNRAPYPLSTRIREITAYDTPWTWMWPRWYHPLLAVKPNSVWPNQNSEVPDCALPRLVLANVSFLSLNHTSICRATRFWRPRSCSISQSSSAVLVKCSQYSQKEGWCRCYCHISTWVWFISLVIFQFSCLMLEWVP